MKLNTTKNFITSTILGILFIHSSVVTAVQPELKFSDISIPSATKYNKIATERVTARLLQSYYRKFQLDDAFSEKIFTRYINDLDYAHYTFLQSDIDELRTKYGNKLDNQLRDGDLSAAFSIYDLAIKRRYERYAYVLSLLDKEPNLSGDDKVQPDRGKAPFPKTVSEADKLWRERVKEEVIDLKLQGKKWPVIKEELIKRYNLKIRDLAETNADDIVEKYLNAFTLALDPHTVYENPHSQEKTYERRTLSAGDIGLDFKKEGEDNVISAITPNEPAWRSGKIHVGDKIIGVGQNEGKIEDVTGESHSDIIDKIRGKKGTKVSIQIESAKSGARYIVTLTREEVHLGNLGAKLVVNKVNGEKIGVINIPSFYIGLTKDVRRLLVNAKNQKIDALVMDLRNNPGGNLDEAIALSGLFINGPVVQTKDAHQHISVLKVNNKFQKYTGPLLVMVNRDSASAAEIFTAAMQDYNRAIIIGQNTFGKGTVQLSDTLNFDHADQLSLGLLKYTYKKFYRINGGATQLKGVTVDIKFPGIINAKVEGEEHKDNALPWDKISATTYSEASDARKYVDVLNKKHLKRVSSDPKFVALNGIIKILYESTLDTKFRSLNYKKREISARKDGDKYLKEVNKVNKQFNLTGKKALDYNSLVYDYADPNFFLSEAEKIAADFAKLNQTEQKLNGQSKKTAK